MSKFDQEQCLHSLDQLIERFDDLSLAIAANNERWIGMSVRGIMNNAAHTRMYLALWDVPEEPGERREREREEHYAHQEPARYDWRTGERIVY